MSGPDLAENLAHLVALDVEDLTFDATRRLRIMIGKSKSDQDQAGAQLAVPYARGKRRRGPRLSKAWAPGRRDRPVFRQMRRGETVTDQRC